MKKNAVSLSAFSLLLIFFSGCISWEERIERADNGDPDAQYYVAQAYRNGDKEDLGEKGKKYYSLALKNGNVDAKKDFCDYIYLEKENTNISADWRDPVTILQAEKFLYELLKDDIGDEEWQKKIVEKFESLSTNFLKQILQQKKFEEAKEFVKIEMDIYSISARKRIFIEPENQYEHCWDYYPYKIFCKNFPATLYPVLGIPVLVADTLCTIVWAPTDLVCYYAWCMKKNLSLDNHIALCNAQETQIKQAIEKDIKISREKEKIKGKIYRYFSLKSELIQLQDLKKHIEKKIQSWNGEIKSYHAKPTNIQIINGFITKRTDDGWYIFRTNQFAYGAFQTKTREYETTGRFSLRVVELGMQTFSHQSLGSVRLPCYREAIEKDELYNLLNENMIAISVKNTAQCDKFMRLIDTQIKQIRELIKKYDKVIAENHIELKRNDISLQDLKEIIEREDIPNLEKMISENLDINQVYSENNETFTILMYAVKNNKRKAVDCLLRHDAFIDALGNIQPTGQEKISALGIAELLGHYAIADNLLNHNACVNNGASPYGLTSRDFLGRPPEEIIARWNRLSEEGGMPQYLSSTAEIHVSRFFLQLEKSNPRFPLAEYWIKIMGSKVLTCTYTSYNVPICSQDVAKLIFP